ncbi:MAG: right-handed parallel beta-helix repeat-containing protein [Firmicutes bacterium]|nr:right-handed parallel beta-helix repeat-containing protein [Bacillota bacterium]
MKKRRNIAIVLAIFLAVVLTIGGSLAYYTYTSNAVQNVVEDNYNWVSMTESEGNPVTDANGNITNSVYEIIPGTSQEKDPTVTASYLLDSYVFLEVTDTSGGLITWATVSDWTLLSAEYDSDGNITHAVYYQLLDTTGTPTGDTPIEYWIQTLPVLEGDQISYSSSISNNNNSVTVDGSGVPTTADTYSLTFQSYIIQADISGSSLTNPSAESAMECWYALAGQQGLGVAAINGVLYPDVTEAILAVEEQGTVTLLTDTTASTGVAYTDEVPQEYTIDLNGFTLTLNNTQMQLSAVENTYVTEANLTSYQSQYGNWIYVGYRIGTEILDTDLTIKNGAIEVVGTSGNIRLESGTTLTLEDVTFTNTTSSTALRAIQYYVSDNTATNTIIVTGCTFDNTYVDICGSSNNKPYSVTATFTDCDFSATPGNGGGCVTFDAYIYGDFTFTDCDFDVTGGGNATGAIVVNSSSSYCSDNSVNLTLNDVTFTGTSTGTYVWSTYTPYPVRISSTSVVNVTDNKASVYSYMLDGNPVTYDGQAITVVTATDANSFSSALQQSSADTTGNTVVALSASTAYTVTSSDITYLSNATIVGAEDGTSTLDVSAMSNKTSVTDLTVSNVTFTTSDTSQSFQISGSGTFTNCTFSSANAANGSSGIYQAYATGDLVFENCTIYGKVYGINIGGGTGNVVLKNCDITGWNSFGNSGTVTVEGCTFHNSGSYGTLRFYQNATVTDCTFDSDFEWIDVNKDGVTITITDCVWTNKTLTDMLYVNGDYSDFSNVKWIVDGVEVTVTQGH